MKLFSENRSISSLSKLYHRASSEIVEFNSNLFQDAETLYANLNYICRHAENAQRPNRPYMPGRQLP